VFHKIKINLKIAAINPEDCRFYASRISGFDDTMVSRFICETNKYLRRKNKMAAINPYLNFNGKTEEAFNFYKSIFGGEFATLQRFGDLHEDACGGEMPEGKQITEADKEKIMHIALPIGNGGNVLMATDGLESMGQKFVEGDNFSISFSADSREDADRIFNGLAEGGKTEMPLADAFWGSYFGMLQDKFGIQWMVSCESNKQ
jgi:PhnB protein